MSTTTIFHGRIAVLATLLAMIGTMLPTGASAADEINLSGLRNNVGICQHPFHDCNFDDGGWSYMAALMLLDERLLGGDTIEHDGFTYTWPDTDPGEADNVEMRGQTIPLLGGFERIGLLSAAHNAPVTLNFGMNYTYIDEDGELAEVTLIESKVLSDWTLNAGGSQPSQGNDIVLTNRGRDASGDLEQVPTHVFEIELDVAVTDEDGNALNLQSITLPNDGRGHIFAMSTQ